MASGSVFSQTLQTITSAKLEELDEHRLAFEAQYTALLKAAESEPDALSRLNVLVQGAKKILRLQTERSNSNNGTLGRVIIGSTGNDQVETYIRNLDRFMEQARHDPSISPRALQSWEASVRQYLSIRSDKYQYADLYGKLVTEWLTSEKSALSDGGGGKMADSFEELPGVKKMESRAEWEKVVFEPANVDNQKLKSYLEDLFCGGTEQATKSFERMRESVTTFQNRFDLPSQFTLDVLRTVISSLQASDLLSNEKRATLKDFLSNEVILKEIVDVLNMRMAALDRWTWGTHVPLEQRRQMNGSYSIHMHEDLLQAIFLHFIGIEWSVFLKTSFRILTREAFGFKKPEVSDTDRRRRHYFLGMQGLETSQCLEVARFRKFRNGYHAYQLLDRRNQKIETAQGEEEADFGDFAVKAKKAHAPLLAQQKALMQQRQQMAQQAPPQAMGFPPAASIIDYSDEEVDCDEQEDSTQARTTPFGAKYARAPQPAQANTGGGLFGSSRPAQANMMRGGFGNAHNQTQAHVEDLSNQQQWKDPYPDRDVYAYDADPFNNLRTKNPMKARQNLLHMLSTEIVINTHLHGELNCFRSVFDSWNPLLPHETILTVLEFLGVTEKWLGFFRKFLEAPLKFIDDGPAAEPRTRRRGTPGSHALSDVFGETVFSCLDLSVHRATDGGMLHRLYDDIWFWSNDYEKCAKAWECVDVFTATTGGKVNTKKTGSARIARDASTSPELPNDRLPQGEIRWGFLYLDGSTGRFEIDANMVDAHISELQKQLQSKQSSVIAWIQTWNTYAATFLSSNFGTPAHCYGRAHVDKMLATHRRVQDKLFGDGGSVAAYLRSTIRARFGVDNVPDGFLYFPVELGGLALHSPFVNLLQIRDATVQDPAHLMACFDRDERADYAAAKERFDKGSLHHSSGLFYKPAAAAAAAAAAEPPPPFFPFAEFAKHREVFSPQGVANLTYVYRELQRHPEQESVSVSDAIEHAVAQLRGKTGLKGITGEWSAMEPYWKWVAQMYGPEMVELFGGLGVVDAELLPIGMVGMVREGRVRWQG